MGYILNSAQIISLLIINILQVFSITTRLDQPPRNFRRHIEIPSFPDWELGLREAVYQALLRERNLQPNLREFLYNAPILGRQDSASPFGDIAILARGQLYSAPGGFQFVQDPYQNDCDGCHNPPPGCDRVSCEKWRPDGHERLLALWSIKRIRHRDPIYGYRYELEYKVSPMSSATREPFITRNGNFDYSIPGHTFIVKSDSRRLDRNLDSYHPDKYQHRSSNSYDSNQWSPNFGPNFDGHYLPPLPPPLTDDYYEEDYYKSKPQETDRFDKNKLYLPPKPDSSESFRPSQHENKEDERSLFTKLLETLSQKTSTTTRQSPATTESTVFDQPKPTTLTTSLLSSQTTSPHLVSSPQMPILPTIPMQQTTYRTTLADMGITKPLFIPATIKFPTTVTSRTKPSLFNIHTTPMTRFSESTSFVKYSEPDPLYSNGITPTITTPKPYSTTSKYKGIIMQDDDYDIFGPITPKPIMKPDLPPPEDAITIVNAPNMVTEKFERTASPSTTEPTKLEDIPKENVTENFNQTRTIPVEDKPHVISLLKPDVDEQNLPGNDMKGTTEEVSTKAATTIPSITSKAPETAPPTLSTEYFTPRINLPIYKTTSTIKTTTTMAPTSTKSTTPFTATRTSYPVTRETKTPPPSTKPTLASIIRTLSPILLKKTTTISTTTKAPTTTVVTTTLPPPAITTTTMLPIVIEEKLPTTSPEITTKTEPPQTTTIQVTTTEKHEITTTDFTTSLPTTLSKPTRRNRPTPLTTTTNTVKQISKTTETSTSTTSTSSPTTRLTKKPSPSTQMSTLRKQTTSNSFKNSVKSTPSYKVTESEEDIEADIFGGPKESSSMKPTSKKPVHQESKEIEEIFGNQAIKSSEESSKETNTPKVIFSGFYSPSTLPALVEETTAQTTTLETTTDDHFKNEATETAEQFSGQNKIVEVNKNGTSTTEGNSFNETFEFEPTIKAQVQELQEIKDYKIYKAEFSETASDANNNTKAGSKGKRNDNATEDMDTNRIFHALALSVVNNAKSIDYLHSNYNNDNCTNAQHDNKVTRERKYRRRGTYRARKTRRREK